MRFESVAVVMLALIVGAACGDGSNDNEAASATPVPTPTACPDRVTYATVGEGSDLDLGLTGNHHDALFSDGGALTLALSCEDPGSEGCVDCTVDGLAVSATAVDNRRCAAALDRTCTADADCPTGTCEYFFGPPVPQAIPGAFVCLVYRVEAAAGVVSPAAGASDVELDALWSFFVPLAVEQPCPVCSGADIGTPGTCAGGDRDGLPCTVHATNDVLGNTSFDCPPSTAAPLGDYAMTIGLTTATASLAANESCDDEQFSDLPCYCPGQRRPNDCVDLVCAAGDAGENACVDGPVDGQCEGEPFRGCLVDSDCPAPGDRCRDLPRSCLGTTEAGGRLVGPLTRDGTPDPFTPTLASVFCVPEGPASAINEGIGFPGPAALRLPVEACFARSCEP